MSDTKHRVAIIGCGRMGQNYAEAYTTYPDTEIISIADANAETASCPRCALRC